MFPTLIDHNTASLTNLTPTFMGSESIAAVTVSKSSSSTRDKSFPPGFRFHPTDEELILYYLKQKISGRSLKLDIIGEIDICKWEPEELPGLAKWNTGDRQWFFFTHRDRKYPNGGRSNRGTMHGYWKATGKDRIVKHNSRTIGVKKTLVFYKGRAPNGQRTDWVMHEYSMDEEELKRCKKVQELYALCKVFKKSGPGPKNGEQYGAPFVEEEWSDNENENENSLDIESLLVNNINTSVNNPTTVETEIVQVQAQAQAQVQPVAQFNPVNGHGSDIVQSAKEPSVVTRVDEMQPLVVNDFLELDDLLSPLPDLQNCELPMMDDLQFGSYDEFFAFEFYDNAIDINPFKSQQSQQLSNDYNHWTQEQEAQDLASTRANDVNTSAPSGVNDKSGKPDSRMNQNQNQITVQVDGMESESWFSSALWAFVESVPTRPESALESSAFDQIPTFGRISDADGDVTQVTIRRVEQSLRLRSIVYFSCLGILCAILCLFLMTYIELLGKEVLLRM